MNAFDEHLSHRGGQERTKSKFGNRLIWLTLLVFFAGLNLWALASDGLGGIPVAMAAGNAWNIVIMVDAGIALLMVVTWMFDHARRLGVSAVPYLLLTLATGSVGTLLYAVRHGGRRVDSRG